MDTLLTSLAQHSGQVLLILCGLVVVLCVFSFSQARKQTRFTTQWRSLLRGATGESLEELLERHLRERGAIERELSSLHERVTELERQLTVSKRHVGLVRYDAFDDVSGNQSFALAVYDDKGDGAILNGIVGRANSRLYCKPLLNGRSERNLSQEEQRAIREARTDGPKTIVSS